MAPAREWPRRDFYEALAMTPLPAGESVLGRSVKRFMSQQPAWKLGDELPWDRVLRDIDDPRPTLHGRGVFGGHVYVQAPLAATRVLQEEDDRVVPKKETLGIHSIQGVFTSPGLKDRPFIYEVSPILSGRSFSACLVNARQPKQPSEKPSGPFPLSDANLPLDDICFSCITTFKRSLPSFDEKQETHSAQERYSDILSSRAPDEWEPCPQVDIDLVKELFPDAGHGAFPILDMHMVDMKAYNADRPIAERRQLMFYRLLKSLPKSDVNAHILCHAFEADRNGLLMLGNHMGYSPVRAASLSYSFYVHVNADKAVMDGGSWWLQEISWPRVSAGRCMMESKTWSPEGRHVASSYQDGIVQPTGEPNMSPKL